MWREFINKAQDIIADAKRVTNDPELLRSLDIAEKIFKMIPH